MPSLMRWAVRLRMGDARNGDCVEDAAKIIVRNSAIRMYYVLFSQQQQQIVAEGDAVIVFVDKDEMKKTLIPEHLRKVIIDLEATVENSLA